ncbi:MAG: pentapeptide repeat-containing protein [Paenibacillus macerans]|uniref:pentapeptide repeat-containing protein n=1 Tax=Paenibacillus TaxID=44249 RepID=UPI000EECB3B0|nr:pentapeptide repeat-containing protein [Paenibacillus macerans]MBS5909191.1 pentapeptide repeat-containing protein [Paenibacillus macerans]MDU5946828.1 pentapeptide repeat-containing protein [Paenibacillus macerans]MDU7472702.1 pentapeptide repeat-containing protein [Paenibacillus macerans]MEC0139071.1 pentapeptide repeat-containing protein [Paenibacillus macerans]UMV47819.1 pentapeptide repeat-containing protein [Paenibacillus macerans]
MNQQEAWARFLGQDALPYRIQYILELHRYYLEHRDAIMQSFLPVFDQLCHEVSLQQQEEKMLECLGIRISLLRTSFLDGEPVYMLEAYDEQTVDGVQITPYRYQAGWIFKYMAEWQHHSEEQRRKYAGKVEICGLEAWMNEQVNPFHLYMVHAVRYAMDQAVQLVSFQNVVKGKQFDIRVGEYRDPNVSESVYRLNNMMRSSISCKRWLENLLEHQYVHEHIAGVNLSLGNYQGINLNYARFEDVDFTSSNMRNSYLLGTKFERCSCDHADFQHSVLIDADFRNCSLENARFDHILASRDLMNEQHAVVFGVRGMLFQQANLTHASFRNAQVAGDFRGAILNGANFSGADMTGSCMFKRDMNLVSLNESQRQSIRWVEEEEHGCGIF